MNASLIFKSQGTFVLEGRSLALEQLEQAFRDLPAETSILVTFEKGIQDRRSVFRKVAKLIYASGLNLLQMDVSDLADEPSVSKPVAG